MIETGEAQAVPQAPEKSGAGGPLPRPALPQAPEPAIRKGRPLLQVAAIVAGSIASYLIITHFVMMSVQVQGMSMSPTLHNGDRFILERYAYWFRDPQPGEIVVIKDPEDNGLSVKRIVARPNDVIELRANGVFINENELDEPYLTANYHYLSHWEKPKPVRLAGNQYFVMGDNRNNSADSRVYGPVSRDRILGYITR